MHFHFYMLPNEFLYMLQSSGKIQFFNFCQSNPVLTQTMAAPAGGAVLWSEDMLRPPDSRVDLVDEVSYLPPEPAFVRPSYLGILVIGILVLNRLRNKGPPYSVVTSSRSQPCPWDHSESVLGSAQQCLRPTPQNPSTAPLSRDVRASGPVPVPMAP